MNFLLEIINVYNFFHGINDPVFPDASCAVFEKLDAVIAILGSRGCNFDDLVRSSMTAFIIYFVRRTDNGDIRLYIVFLVFV